MTDIQERIEKTFHAHGWDGIEVTEIKVDSETNDRINKAIEGLRKKGIIGGN